MYCEWLTIHVPLMAPYVLPCESSDDKSFRFILDKHA